MQSETCQYGFNPESGKRTYIDDSTESANRVWSVDNLEIRLHIFHDRRGDHDDILGNLGELLDDEVDHLTECTL
jgi:hypothetical protein